MSPVDNRDYVLSGIYYPVWNHTDMRKTIWLSNCPCKHETLTQCWSNAGPPFATLTHHQACTGSTPRVCSARWSGSAYCWRRVQADTDPMSVKCWASVAGAGQYPFSPSHYFMLAIPARCIEPKLGEFSVVPNTIR